MAREKSKERTFKDESTEARHRGGPTRSSEEVFVMETERRGWIDQSCKEANLTKVREEPASKTKPFCISKHVVKEAYERVKANKGAAGVDSESLADFEVHLKQNLYKIWNRMSSGSYFPPPVRAVDIGKPDGGQRRLGIPTVSDRIAQMVVKLYLEPDVDQCFHPDSYGYRPQKSALDAVGEARRRCWKFSWVLDLDIKGFFDNIDHRSMMRIVKLHTDCRWMQLYIERWLKAPVQLQDGRQVARETGTPQGGVISPLLANMFLHYAFDEWMRQHIPYLPFERYADDIIVHCKSKRQAIWLKDKIRERLHRCNLELHPLKTKIVCCRQEASREEGCEHVAFDFLGYTFKPRHALGQDRKPFTGFTPAVSSKSLKKMYEKIRQWCILRQTGKSVTELARLLNPTIHGWINYYGKYRGSALVRIYHHINTLLLKWVQKKYKRFKGRKRKALRWLGRIASQEPGLFAHWCYARPRLVNKSRMS